MSTACESDLRLALARASEWRDVTWKWWVYSAEGDILVLCAYRPAFEVVGYLVFRRPSHVRLPYSFQAAEFSEEQLSAAGGSSGPPKAIGRDARVVVIRTQERELHVICDSVALYCAGGHPRCR